MTNSIQRIDCPNPECNGKIDLNPYLLLQGKSFECKECNSFVSLNNDSKPVLSNALTKLEELKNQQ